MCIRSTSFQTPEKYSLLRNVSCNYRIEIPIINLHLWFGLFFEKINKKSIFVLQWKCDYLTKCTKLYRILTWFRTFNAGFLTHFAIKKYNCIFADKGFIVRRSFISYWTFLLRIAFLWPPKILFEHLPCVILFSGSMVLYYCARFAFLSDNVIGAWNFSLVLRMCNKSANTIFMLWYIKLAKNAFCENFHIVYSLYFMLLLWYWS